MFLNYFIINLYDAYLIINIIKIFTCLIDVGIVKYGTYSSSLLLSVLNRAYVFVLQNYKKILVSIISYTLISDYVNIAPTPVL